MLFIHRSTPSFDCRTTASLRAFTRDMSTRTSPPVVKPNSAPRRATWMARALATSVFVGIQPTFTHVPPKRRRSRTAVLRPAFASRAASEGPAWPVPITMAS